METQPNIEVVGQRRTNWWLVAGGAVLILFAIGTFAFPGIFLAAITILAGFGFLVSGVAGIATFIRSRELPGAWWTLILALLDVVVGVLMLIHPVAFAPTVPWLLGIVFMSFGVVEVIATTPIGRLVPETRPINIVSGVLTVLVGVLFIIWPESLSMWVAAFAALRGITLVVMGFLTRT